MRKRNRLLPKVVVSAWSLALITMGGGLIGHFLAPNAAQAAELGAACVDCHEKPVASFKASYHARIWQGKNDCQSCHGATDKHVNDPSKETILSFDKSGGRTAADLSKQCLNCHASSSPHLALWEMGAHKRNDVTCVSCHDIHTGKAAVAQPNICYTCHKDVKMAAGKQSHHPINEGKIKCSDCHNTHGTQSHGMIKEDNVNQLCYKCHADKRGPFMWEHPPVEENCATCHDPHGSRHGKLLTEKIPNLCQDCHDWSRHPGTPYDNTNGIAGTSPSSRMFARSCLNCHNQIHGSTAPANPSSGYNSGQKFVR
ncbi:DmsE family decaheme c-type cytochrome [Desulfovibrionaceae bacterium CB1MN]|uniref:DmsE family decaheme c-type cytochrome n=1 Tax=Hydrosulfovibrio ferrireducens TaxID=2934181 RepID=UPI003ABAD5E7